MEGFVNNVINSKSKTFLAFCFCFLAGVASISVIDKKIPFVWLYGISFIILSFIIAFCGNRKIRFVLFCCSVVLFAVFRYQLAYPFHEIQTGPADFTGYISVEPDIRQDGVRYIVEMQNFASLHSKVYFKYQLYPRFNYGDELRLICDLEKPEPFDDFRYDKFLAARGVFLVCNNPQIEKIGGGGGNFVLKNILKLKNAVAEKVNALWHEPYAGFMAGLLYGYRGGLGELNELFNRTGITHIIAISGYNISIIASVLIAVFIHLLIPRKKAFWLVVSGIILFVIFTGASPSVMRAGVMGILVLIAKQIGRLSRVGNVLVLTAAAMVLLNPFVLVWDAGFQLSFTATLGLVYLSPVLEKLAIMVFSLRNSSRRYVGAQTVLTSKTIITNFSFLKDIFISTLSAILATLPLILFQFGRLSIVALPVNILVLWIIPFLMLGGFLAVVFSFVFFPVGQVIAWVTFAGMKYVTSVVDFFGNLKFAAVDLTIPWWFMAAMYVLMVYFVVKFSEFPK